METILIRKIKSSDTIHVRDIIRTVMPEFGASGQGFAIHDTEVSTMFDVYTKPKSVYFVCELNGTIIGGGGVAPLLGGDENICELKKMYFLPAGRGKGLGQRVLSECLKAAKELGFEYCYLETFNTMNDAMKLYEKNGFKKIPGPLGNTGHFSCDIFYKRSLK